MSARIGRFRVETLLGEGSTGAVYRGEDESLGRKVAIKVLHRDLVEAPQHLATFLAEARILASLDHPSIVPVYDVGHVPDQYCYLVAKFIEGQDLKHRVRQGRLSPAESVQIVARIAEALHYAHQRRLVHRDIKPGNILVNADNQPFLIDFGLALRDQDIGRGPTFVGTVPYMSPEQARHEGHRVDARTDIYSLGVVLYELLTGRRPFVSDSMTELLDMIRSREVPPLRSVEDTLSPELERICLKALANRVSDRYLTAQDLADDLWHWHKTEGGDRLGTTQQNGRAAEAVMEPAIASAPVVPRGLRSFTPADAGFFLDLLPGPRNRQGLPESVAFWKCLLESRDPDEASPIGLLYGPSGCGKSSLLKAGVLPRLDSRVVPVIVEATPDQTEAGLLRGLRRAFPGLTPELSLADTMLELRRGRALHAGDKVVIVIDQFEQWLNPRRPEDDHALAAALRQCDGVHVQCLLLVRDDFWLAVSRFLHELEIPLVQGKNAALVDLFDVPHARQVLTRYGRAFGRLPDGRGSAEQERFLDKAIAGIAEQGRVVPVRLALFAEMVKGKPWQPGTLRDLGGMEGVGIAFLEETFQGASAPAPYRRHEAAARAVLRSLLPEPGVDLKGRRLARPQLEAASGYEGRPEAFSELLSALDQDLRLVSPADPGGVVNDPGSASTEQVPHFQLTHDYLVPAIREWTARQQRATRRGRAELHLTERTQAWNARPEPQQLPSWGEWLSIRLFTRRRQWSDPQRRMMQAADRSYLRRATVGLLLLTTLILASWYVGWLILDERNGHQADNVIASIRDPQVEQWDWMREELRDNRPWLLPRLIDLLNDPESTHHERLRVRLLLLPEDTSHVGPLSEALWAALPREVVENSCSIAALEGLVHRRSVAARGRATESTGMPPGRERPGSVRSGELTLEAVQRRDYHGPGAR